MAGSDGEAWIEALNEKIRFCVVDDKDRQRSSHWFVREANGSLYLTAAALGNHVKLSLHPRGISEDGNDTQFGTTRGYYEARKKLGHENGGFHWRWKRAECEADRFSVACEITFPTNGLHWSAGEIYTGKKRIAFPMAPPGHAVAVSILYSSFDPTPREDDLISGGYTPIMCYELGSNEYAIFGARQVPFDDSLLEVQLLKGGATWLEGAAEPGGSVSNASAILICSKPIDSKPLLLANVSGLTVNRSG